VLISSGVRLIFVCSTCRYLSLEDFTIFYVQVVKLASETFNYPRIDIEKSKAKKIVLEHFPKVRIVFKDS
jgi:hypothetical protein